jgi:hypothetical protein
MKGARGWSLGTAAVWALVVAGGGLITWAAAVPLSAWTPDTWHRSPAVVADHERVYPADSLARVSLVRPLFRTGRRAASVAYDPTRGAQPLATEPRPPKPVLLLVGIVTGADPSAVIEGFPGIEDARVVRPGDVIAGLRVQRITDNAVRITGMDTVWVLQVREPWR